MNYSFRKVDIINDIATLFEIMTNPNEQKYFPFNVNANNNLEFEKWFVEALKYYYHDFYIVENLIVGEKEKNFVGFIYTYDYRIYDGHCKICIYLNEAYRHTYLWSVILEEFIDLIFREYPIRRIITVIYCNSKEKLNSYIRLGFKNEGKLINYKYFEKKYHDINILAIDRKQFYENGGTTK